MALFELIEPVPGAPPPPGPWGVRPSGELAFSTAQPAVPLEPVWRASFSAELLPAQQSLARAGQMLVRQRQSLEGAAGRLERIAQPGMSFSPGQIAQPEQKLLLLVGDIRAAEQPGYSYGLGDTISASWEAAQSQFQAFVLQVQETISNYALVETLVAGQIVGRTRVGWTGNVASAMLSPTLGEHRDLHFKTLQLALESRLNLIHTWNTVLRGAAIVATMISSPIGTLTALPAAWRFIEDLLSSQREP